MLGGPGLTRRVAVLAAIGLVLAVVLAPYLRAWVEQRAALAALRQEVADREQRVRELEQERDRWEDPAHVTAEARRRLRFVLPGETAYVVVPPPQAVAEQPAAEAARVALDERPWYGDLWESVRVAAASEPSVAPEHVDPAPAPPSSAP